MTSINITPFDPDSYLHFVYYRCSECGCTDNIPAKPNVETSVLICPRCHSTLVRDPTSMIGIRFMSNWFLTDQR